MSALWANCLNLAGGVDEQNLGTFNALDIDFSLLAGLERQSGDVLELELGHVASLRNVYRFEVTENGTITEYLWDANLGRTR